jgi:Reverse transcriptase (RNA-dependent DNA polymerase)
VDCGYSQIPGIDFNESYASVISNVHFMIKLIAKLIWVIQAIIIDFETAFIYGKLEGEIYMKIHEGLNTDERNCLMLKKTIHGIVQSAREFQKKLIQLLKGAGFIENNSDSCLLSK